MAETSTSLTATLSEGIVLLKSSAKPGSSTGALRSHISSKRFRSQNGKPLVWLYIFRIYSTSFSHSQYTFNSQSTFLEYCSICLHHLSVCKIPAKQDFGLPIADFLLHRKNHAIPVNSGTGNSVDNRAVMFC